MVVKISLSIYEDSGLDVYSDRNLPNLEYADDVVLLTGDPSTQQVFRRLSEQWSDHIRDTFCTSELWKTFTTELVQNRTFFFGGVGNKWGIDRFSYMGSCVSPCGRIGSESSPFTQKTRFTFTYSRHLWHWCGIWLSAKFQLYTVGLRLVLLYASETWSVTAYMRKFSMFERCWLGSIGGTWRENFLYNADLGITH